MICSIISVSVYCEVGEQISKIFDEIKYEVSEIDWNMLLSNDMSRSFVTIIMVSHETVQLRGFGSIAGSRDAFKKVKMMMTPC